MSSKYTKKPEVVDALQYDGENVADLETFAPGMISEELGAVHFRPTVGADFVLNVGDWVVKDGAGMYYSHGSETFDLYYKSEATVGNVFVGRYVPKPVVAVEAVTWSGDNFVGVQVVCPQASLRGLVVEVPGSIEVYVGEVVLRNLASGEFSKMDGELFNVFYGGQLL